MTGSFGSVHLISFLVGVKAEGGIGNHEIIIVGDGFVRITERDRFLVVADTLCRGLGAGVGVEVDVTGLGPVVIVFGSPEIDVGTRGNLGSRSGIVPSKDVGVHEFYRVADLGELVGVGVELVQGVVGVGKGTFRFGLGGVVGYFEANLGVRGLVDNIEVALVAGGQSGEGGSGNEEILFHNTFCFNLLFHFCGNSGQFHPPGTVKGIRGSSR